jgi:hypothetical protein
VKGLAPYIVMVVLLAIGGVILISQQAAMTRLGNETAMLHAEAARIGSATFRVRLRLAHMKSAERLAKLAERFELGLVPPEAALSADEKQDAPSQ